MAVAACLWCETKVKPGAVACPECGLQNPAGDPKRAPRGGSGKIVRRGRRIALALVVMTLMLSVAYAAHSGVFPLASTETASASDAGVASAPQPPVIYSDPLQRAVWTNGVKAVQQALGQPDYASFANSYVDVAAGHVVSFCGEVAGTSGYDSASGARRFISVFGQTYSTLVEGNDASFGVLWNRVCAQAESSS